MQIYISTAKEVNGVKRVFDGSLLPHGCFIPSFRRNSDAERPVCYEKWISNLLYI